MNPAASREALAGLVEQALGERPLSLTPLSGGSIAAVHRARLSSGADLVIKSLGAPMAREPDGALEIEAAMLRYLAAHSALPVPRIRYSGPGLLIMDYIEAGDPIDAAAERHAAELLAALHSVHADRFGHETDTVIAGLHQPNRPTGSWLDFFRDQRLLHMAHVALDAGRIAAGLTARIERFAARLDRFIEPGAPPSLIHGDLWAGNILVRRGRVVGVIDPAIYYADAEIELAFATLFESLGSAFFQRYHEIVPSRPGFFEARRDIYNLYPLLVHARLFGGHYAEAIGRTLQRFGG